MEKLIVDEEGKITIPAHALSRRGLLPGDVLLLVEVAEGLLLCQQRRQARDEAQRYEGMSEEKRDRVWGDRTESAEERVD